MLRIGLVSCGKAKLSHPAAAKDLYVGSLFRAASAYASNAYDEWWILSAKHGVVHPDTVLEPYDLAITDLSFVDRARWGSRVLNDLIQNHRYMLGQKFYIHAGKPYRDVIWARSSGLEVEVPLEGLMIGQQLHWYAERRKEAA